MIKHFITYKELCEILSYSKRTLERNLPKMNIQKRYFNGGRPRFLIHDVYAYLLNNKNYKECTQVEKIEVKDLLNDL